LNRDKSFTVAYGGRFPCSTHGIPTR
jgi:hypothetical protein